MKLPALSALLSSFLKLIPITWASLKRKVRFLLKTPHHLYLGAKSERIAVSYLKRSGHKILSRNYSTRFGEIDIVSSHRGFVIFSEVKSGIVHSGFYPRDKVDARKREKLYLVADTFLKKYKLTGSPVRFDIIEVNFKSAYDRKPEVIHLKGEL